MKTTLNIDYADSFKTSAIVLKKYPFGEYDEIVHMLSEDYGKIKAFAKGSRKLKSSFMGTIEPFYEIMALLSHGKNFDRFFQSEVKTNHNGIIKNLSALYAGFYFLELADQMLSFMNPEPKIYAYLKKILLYLENNVPDDLFISSALFHFLKLCGNAPALKNCCRCGIETEVKRFDPVYGGNICNACEASNMICTDLHAVALIADISVMKIEDLKNKYFYKKVFGDVRTYLESYLRCHIGVELKSLSVDRELFAVGLM